MDIKPYIELSKSLLTSASHCFQSSVDILSINSFRVLLSLESCFTLYPYITIPPIQIEYHPNQPKVWQTFLAHTSRQL